MDEAPPRRRSRRNAVIVLIALVLVAITAWLLTRGGARGAGANRRPAATVGTAQAVRGEMPVTISEIGTVQPEVTATVRTQLAGVLFSLNFREGQIISKGQLLAQIDPRPYRLALAQAEANLARDQAQLNLANVDLNRYRTLLSQDSIARQQVDTQAATVRQLDGTVAADRAAIGTARLNLAYSAIAAPVGGRIGLRQVDLGNYVTPSDANGIAVITQTDPIDVSFAVPQAQLPALQTRIAGGTPLPVTATDQGGQTSLAQGSFLTLDNQVDASSGTVKAKARFANADGKLFPNLFVNVKLLVDTLHDAVVVPISAVRHGAKGDFVFLLQSDRTVKLQLVRAGPSDGTRVAILSGVTAGATVITEGADALDDGSSVKLAGDHKDGASGGGGGGGGRGDAGRHRHGTAG